MLSLGKGPLFIPIPRGVRTNLPEYTQRLGERDHTREWIQNPESMVLHPYPDPQILPGSPGYVLDMSTWKRVSPTHIMKAQFLLHYSTSTSNRYIKSLAIDMVNAAKQCIPVHWRSPQTPSIKEWLPRIARIAEMERLIKHCQQHKILLQMDLLDPFPDSGRLSWSYHLQHTVPQGSPSRDIPT